MTTHGSTSRRRPWGWLAAAVLVALATAVAEALPSGDEISTGLYVLAVLAAALVGGHAVAFATTVVSAVIEWWYFSPNPQMFRAEDAADLVPPAVVLVAGALVTVAASGVQRARWRAEAEADSLAALNRLAVALGDLEVGGVAEVDALIDNAVAVAGGRLDAAAVGALRATALERLELRAAERRAQAAEAFIANAMVVLAGAIEPDAVIEEVRKLVVPMLADTCTVELGEIATDDGDDGPDVLRIPLRSRQRTVATLVCTRHDRGFEDHDRRVAEELAARAAQALDAALAYAEQARSSTILQRSLLPQGLVAVDNIAVATRYVAASAGQEVGGDFYDVIATRDLGAILIIGDVQGKGVEAATLTAVARHTLRAAALDDVSPGGMLARLNHALLYGQEEAARSGNDDALRFVTAGVVRLTPTETGFRATAASGGHPPPLLVRAGGSVEQLLARGMVLGVFHEPEFQEIHAELTLADTVVLYTDGATEQSHRGDFDEQELGRLVRYRLGPVDAEAVAQLILDTVLQMAPGQPRDDLAVVVACVTGPR